MKKAAMKTLVCALMTCLPLAAFANDSPSYQAPESIRQAAIAAIPGFGNSDVEVDAVVDSALRLPACNEALSAHPATGGTVEVACPGMAGWRLYIPVKVRRYQEVLVLQRPLNFGETLSAGVVALERREVAKVSGALVDIAGVQGYSLRRPLAAGVVLTSADVVSPRLVKRGDSVTLVARAGGIEVRAQGKAMNDAGVGERVSVENLSSRRTLQGMVLAGGDVQVGF